MESQQAGRSEYLDFELEVGMGRGREYPVAILRSPAGEARETMHFPFDELALENRLLNLQNVLLRSGGKHRRVPTEEEQAVQDFGQTLFDTLFRGEIRSTYDMSLREADQQDQGLRLKLRIRPPELNALPWEFMYDPRQTEYVCLSRQTPIVRYLESPRLIRPLTVTPPLRLLGMIASPEDQPVLDVEREKQRVERAIQGLQGRGLVELEWLPGQSWRDLQRAMWGGPWHIFHFIGHGGFDVQADEGFIALADRAGRTHCLSATRLGRLLADHQALRLVVLNSCEGARGGDRDVFSSMASILVRRGIPAVLAMQYEITDRAAVELARAFYEALAYDMAVDEAVVVARKAISLAVTNTVEWGTPVLYMRTPDGVLFHLTGALRAEAPAPEPPADEELEQRLGQHYTAGLSAFWLEEWDRACGHFQAIVEARPNYEDAADKLAEARRQQKWSELYEQAQAARKAENWSTTFSALEELVAEKPDYKDAAALLEVMNRQKRLDGLYAQAQRLHRAQAWQAVVNIFAQIAALDPDYPDPEELLPAAKQGMAEQVRRAELDDLYNRALQEMDVGRWAEARRLLRQVQKQEPGYLETERLLARAESEQVCPEAEARSQRGAKALARRLWLPVGLGVLVLVVLIVTVSVTWRRAALVRSIEQALHQELDSMDGVHWDGQWAMEELDDGSIQLEVEVRSPQDVLPMQVVELLGLQERIARHIERPVALDLSVIPTTYLDPRVPPTPTPIADKSSTRAKDGMVMVYVPGGEFAMGSSDAAIDAVLAECSDCERDEYKDEQPQHGVTLDAFWVDQTEVTNAQFRKCVEAGRCQAPTTCDWGEPTYKDSSKVDHPVVCVDWNQANAYCQWAGARLPTEAEWEKAARGTDGRTYPWGDSAPDCNKAQYGECDGQRTVPVGSKGAGASPYDALDMSGNVWEWVSDWYDANYYEDLPDSNPPVPASRSSRVLRGGSWRNNWHGLRAADRNYRSPAYRSSYLGFRCASSPGE